MTNWQKYAAEVYGTFVLVGVGTGTVLAAGGMGSDGFQIDYVAVSLAFGLGLIAALYAVGGVSGGHFNPAVSLGAYLDRRISFGDMFGYWVAQVAGAILASLVFAYVLSADFVGLTRTTLGTNPATGETIGAFDGILGEAVFTLVFVLAVLVISKKPTATAYLGIGLTLSAVHLVTIGFTGASINPARSLGPAIVSGEFGDIAVYLVGPLSGAVLAWLLYRFVVVDGDSRLADDLGDMG